MKSKREQLDQNHIIIYLERNFVSVNPDRPTAAPLTDTELGTEPLMWTTVPDRWHYGTNPDLQIHTSD